MSLLATSVKAETSKFWQHTSGDLHGTFVQWPVLILAGGTVAAISLHSLDDNVDRFVNRHRTSDEFDTAGDWLGNPFFLGPLALATYGSSYLTNNDEFKMTSETVVEALVFNTIMTEAIKVAFRRERPNSGTLSFPSAHTSTAFAIAASLQEMQGWKFGVPAFLFAGLVGFSRVDVRDHYMTDVIFGAALGSAIGFGTALFHKEEGTKLLISPIFDQTRGLMLSYKF